MVEMLPSLFVVLLQTANAAPPISEESPNSPTEEPADEAEFSEVLTRAKAVYFAGRDDEALDLFTGLQVRLLLGETPAWDMAATAMIYVGEIQYRRGHIDEARDAFRWLLDKDPDYQISPYSHPIEVVAIFSTVRDQVRRSMGDVTEQPQDIDPMPGWGYLPLGIPQFRSGRPVVGTLFAGLQVGLTATSIGVYANLAYLNGAFPEEQGNEWLPADHPRGWAMKDSQANTNRIRYAINLPLALAAYGAYIGSVFEARAHWRNNFEPPVRVSVIPTPHGETTVVISRRF
jgi:hypothetical protein